MRTKSVGASILVCLILILGACQNPSSTDTGTSIQWQGYLAAAPTGAVKNWAYFDTVQDQPFIYDGSTWKLLAKGVTPTGTAIAWKGNFAVAPASPASGWMYYNTADKKTYLHDGTTWQTIAVDNVLTVNQITWLGQLAAAPAAPKAGDSYFNTADGKTYLYSGTAWATIAANQTTNTTTTISQITWKGESAAVPTGTAVLGWAYFNTTDDVTYLYDGTAWQTIASDTVTTITNTNTITQITWEGQSATAPTAPVVGSAYYSTADLKTYLYDGSAWRTIATDSQVAVSVSSIIWKGSFASAPANPLQGWAYYNTVDFWTYLFVGSSWQVIAKSNGPSLNATGSVAPGGYLALAHGLGRDDLTFKGQFTKNNRIYDFDEYATLFSADSTLLSKTVFEGAAVNSVVIARSPVSPYNILVAYKDEGNGSGRGTYCVYSAEGTIVKAPTTFTSTNSLDGLAVCALATGKFVLAYRDTNDNNQGYFNILSQDGSTWDFSTMQKFTNGGTAWYIESWIDCATLSDGKFVIAFNVCRSGVANDATFVIYNANGTLSRGIETYCEVNYSYSDSKIMALPTAGEFALVWFHTWPGASNTYPVIKHYSNAGVEVHPASSLLIDNCDTAWTGGSSVTPSADNSTGNFKDASSNKLVVAEGAAINQRLAYKNFPSGLSLGTYQQLGLWIKSSIALSKDELQIRMDHDENGPNIDLTLRLPTIPADTWVYISPTNNNGHDYSLSTTPYKYIEIYQTGTDLGAFNFWFDDLRAAKARILSPDPANPESGLTVSRLTNGKLLCFISNYNDNVSSVGRGYSYLWDSSADNLLLSSQFSPNQVDRLESATLSDGTVALVMRDRTHYVNQVMIFGTDGIPVERTLTFTNNDPDGTYSNPIAALSDGMYAIAYRNNEESNNGTLFHGGNFRLSLEKVDSNEVHLHNYSAETLTLNLSVDQ